MPIMHRVAGIACLLAWAMPPTVAAGQDGLVAVCGDGAGHVGAQGLVADCTPLPDPSLAELYRRLATGAHYEYRDLDAIVVVRPDTDARWHFHTGDDEILMAVRYRSQASLAGARTLVAAYCDEAAVDCRLRAARVLDAWPPVLAPFPPHEFLDARLRDDPATDMSACSVAPACREPMPPRYPGEARSQCIGGVAVVLAYADRDGCVCDVKIERSSRNRGLDRAAIDAVRQWRMSQGAGKVLRIPVEFDPLCKPAR